VPGSPLSFSSGGFPAQYCRVALAVLQATLDAGGRRLLVKEDLYRQLPAAFH